MSITLHKYHGLGNDYLVYDPHINHLELTPERIRLLCDRHYGLGADGLLLGPIFEGTDIRVKIYNPDASEATNSGNGIRIFARFLRDTGYTKEKKFDLLTDSGRVDIECLKDDSSVTRVSLGAANYWGEARDAGGRDVPGEQIMFEGAEHFMTCLYLGNPNCVVPMENISAQLAIEMGECIARSEQFAGGINFNLMKVHDRGNIDIEVFERGAGYTLASGAGAGAAASTAYSLGLTDINVTVHMPGGTIEVEIAEDGNVFMTGTVESVGITELTREFEHKLLLVSGD